MLPTMQIDALRDDCLGRVWATTARGLFYYEDGRWSSAKALPGWPADATEEPICDRAGALWVPAGDGMHVQRKGAQRFEPAQLPAPKRCELVGTPHGALWLCLLFVWALLGASYSAAQLPTGRLLRRSAHAVDRPSLFAAQFALSHACWLLTYPLAGWLGTIGMPAALLTLGMLAALGTALACILWPAPDPEAIAHEHADLAAEHPHLAGGARTHRHAFVIDDLHQHWPASARNISSAPAPRALPTGPISSTNCRPTG
jgi:hypothetical protein